MVEDNAGILVVGGRKFLPSPEWVLIGRDGVIEKSEGGIYIPDTAKHGCCKGTVIDAGAKCDGLKRGDRVLYLANLTKRDVRAIYGEAPETQRLCLVHINAIQAQLVGESVPDDFLADLVAASQNLKV